MEIQPEISILIRQFNYGRNGGSASAILLGPKAKSAFDDRPYAAIEIGFSLWNVEPSVNPELQVLHMMPDSRTGRSYLLIGFIQETVVPRREAEFLLADTSYRGKIAKMIANMVATAELISLADDPPTVI